jgi:hypothetical protein
MNPGDLVVVLTPFADAFPGVHTVASVGTADDGQTVIYLEGIESAFAPMYLEAAP